ncbi:hypothetical protein [Streptomyces sp. NPDC041003]|uniref:hypothetical protein n=1 Tax=Streptomyces sp. NPDC041003 TaxID=3155730 RepID=UPI0033C1D12D
MAWAPSSRTASTRRPAGRSARTSTGYHSLDELEELVPGARRLFHWIILAGAVNQHMCPTFLEGIADDYVLIVDDYGYPKTVPITHTKAIERLGTPVLARIAGEFIEQKRTVLDESSATTTQHFTLQAMGMAARLSTDTPSTPVTHEVTV